MGTNGAATSPIANITVDELASLQQRVRRTTMLMSGVAGMAGGMATALIMRRAEPGEERAKSAVKGGAIGGVAALLLVLGFRVIEGTAAAAAPRQPAPAPVTG
jgi:hypothetical protein